MEHKINSDNSARERSGERLKYISTALAGALIIVVLYFLSRNNYPLFHSFVDMITVFIAASAFIVVWNRRNLLDNHYYLYVGIAFLFFAFLDFIHLVGNKDMGVFPQFGNLGPTLYIASRYVISISLVIAPLFIRRKLNAPFTLAVYSVITIFILVSIFYWKNFPVTYIEGAGLTPFKVISDYIICFILLGAIGLLYFNRRSFEPKIYRMITYSLVFSIATGLAFTLYTDPFGITNAIGHFFQIGSFYLVYRAFVETVLTKPQDILYRNLKQSREEVLKLNTELEKVNLDLKRDITERKKAEEALRKSEEQLQLKLDSVLSPDVAIEEQELANILDVKALQSLMEYLYAVTGIEFAIIDLKGKVLVGTKWQDACTKFHRINPQTLKNCLESDILLSRGVKRGEFKEYRCKNNMWDMVTPLYIGGKHVGNVFTGQFFYDDEQIDYEFYAAQAERYGFDKEAYLNSIKCVPRHSREKVKNLMTFFSMFSELVSRLSYSNLKVAKAMSDAKKDEESLQKYARELENANQEMESFSYSVSHDLRAPLRGMMGFSQILMEDYSGKLDEQARQYLTGIQDSGILMSRLIDDLLKLSRVTREELHREKVDLGRLAAEVFAEIEKREPERKVEFRAQDNLEYQGDARLLRIVLENLLGNAWKFTGKVKNARIELGHNKDNGVTAFYVRDNGAGFDMAYADKLFQPFQRLHSSKEFPGTGIGLATVKRIIQRHGGRVWAESQPGKGTVFYFTLS